MLEELIDQIVSLKTQIKEQITQNVAPMLCGLLKDSKIKEKRVLVRVTETDIIAPKNQIFTPTVTA